MGCIWVRNPEKLVGYFAWFDQMNTFMTCRDFCAVRCLFAFPCHLYRMPMSKARLESLGDVRSQVLSFMNGSPKVIMDRIEERH